VPELRNPNHQQAKKRNALGGGKKTGELYEKRFHRQREGAAEGMAARELGNSRQEGPEADREADAFYKVAQKRGICLGKGRAGFSNGSERRTGEKRRRKEDFALCRRGQGGRFKHSAISDELLRGS